MALEFEEIKELAKARIREREKLDTTKPLTEKNIKDIAFYVKQIEKYVQEYAEKGKQVFKYDCSKLEKHVFYALAAAFKEENKNFFVMVHSGCQELTIDWTGKHEV
jgi:hypothetical protein